MAGQEKPKRSLTKLQYGCIFFLGFVCLYYAGAIIVAEVFSLHSPWLGGGSSYTKGSGDIILLQQLLSGYPPIPKSAAELRKKLVEIGKKDSTYFASINNIALNENMNRYIVDLEEFISFEKGEDFPKKILPVQGCETERILYLYRKIEQKGFFFLCNKNSINPSRHWECCG